MLHGRNTDITQVLHGDWAGSAQVAIDYPNHGNAYPIYVFIYRCVVQAGVLH